MEGWKSREAVDPPRGVIVNVDSGLELDGGCIEWPVETGRRIAFLELPPV